MEKVIFDSTGNKKHDGNLSTLNRLIGILSCISQGDRPTAKELAQAYEVSVRTIQMDINNRLDTFPIVKDDQHRYGFEYGFSLNRTSLSSDEMILLQLALSQFKEVSDFDKITNSLYKKLIQTNFINPYYIKQEDIEDIDIDSPIIQKLETSIESCNKVKVITSKNEIILEPYKIINIDGYWYLFCKDCKDNKLKTIMISNIKSVEMLHQKFTMDHKNIEKKLNKINSPWFDDADSYEVKVKVHKEVAVYFKQKDFLSSQKIETELEDGSLIITFEINHDEDIDNIIKSWLPHIEVLEPFEFRDRLKNELQEYLEKLD